ncbi:MAG: ACP phosphodiesterase [Bacteroidetes bacterium]|nr:ACP phosphodiesterase [Bacteroidota bacterium]
MNYLAHLFLSGKNDGIIVGNILEDFISGHIEHPKNAYIPEDIKLGLKMHRMIDTFTDSHAVLKESKALFYPINGKYASIVMDVLYDHFLQKNWENYSSEEFDSFRKRIYESIRYQEDIQPENMKKLVNSMIEHDWLKNYIEIWGLEKAFNNLNKRINKPEVDLIKSLSIFEKNYDFLDLNFKEFFPELLNASRTFLKENHLNG